MVLGHMTADASGDYQRLSTTDVLGFDILNPVNVSGPLSVSGQSFMTSSLQVATKTTVQSTLSVASDAYLKKTADISGATSFNSSMVVAKGTSVTGASFMQSTLQTLGSVNLVSTADIKGEAFLESTLNAGDAVILGTEMNVNGPAMLNSSLMVAKNMDIQGATLLQSTLLVYGSVMLQSTLDIKGHVALWSTLDVKDSAILSSTMQVSGGSYLSSTMKVSGSAFMSSTLSVAGATTVQSTVAVNDKLAQQGASFLQSTLQVQSQTFLTASLDVKSDTTMRQTTNVQDEASFQTTMDVCGGMVAHTDLKASDTLLTSGATFLHNTLTVSQSGVLGADAAVLGATRLYSTLSVSGGAYLNGVVSVAGVARFESSLAVNGTTSISGAAILNSTLQLSGTGVFSKTMGVVDTVLLRQTLSVAGAVLLESTLSVLGAVVANSTMVVNGSTQVSGEVVVSGNLQVSGAVAMSGVVDVTGAVKAESNLVTQSDMDVCGNVRVKGSLSVGTGATFSGPFKIGSTLSVGGTTYLESSMQTNVVRPYGLGDSVTVDASKVIINGSVDLIGSINNTFNTAESFLVEDKLVKLAYDLSGSVLQDGKNTNSDAGIEVAGLPDGVSSDQYNLYEKSLKWKYDNLQGASWANLGTNAADLNVLPKEPAWLLRGGAFKLAHQMDASSSVIYTMRANRLDEFEIWQSISEDGGVSWKHVRVSRMGLSTAVPSISIISYFSVKLGYTTIGATSLSLEITNILDNLYFTKRVVSAYTVTEVALIDSCGNTYNAQNGFTFGTINGNTTNSNVVTTPQIITGLPSDTAFIAVSARITNQYGVSTSLMTSVSPEVYTLDVSGPQIIGSVSVTPNNQTRTLSTTIVSFDVGKTTTTYKGILLVSTSNSLSLTGIDASSAGITLYTFNGTGKTSGTADTNLFTIDRDISGNVLTAGNHYIYYILYDPLGNRTESTTPIGPYKIVTSVVSAFTATLGVPTVGTDRLSLAITNVTDTLYTVNGITPSYTVSNIKLKTPLNVEYTPQIGFSLGSFTAAPNGVVVMTVQTVTGLPSDVSFNRVLARITNQYGFYGDITATINPVVYTYDASGPQVVGSVSVTTTSSSVGVTIVSYDIGATTSNYTGVLFVSKLNTYDASGVTAVTPNTQSYTGTGKTLGTADSKVITISTDISGAAVAEGSYYVYYVLYDPIGNKTLSYVGPYTVATAFTVSRSVMFNPLNQTTATSSLVYQNYATCTTLGSVLQAADTANTISISWWVKGDTRSDGSSWLYGTEVVGGGAGGNGHRMMCPYQGNGLMIHNNMDGYLIYYDVLRRGEWNHIVYSKTGSTTIVFYINGVKYTTPNSITTFALNPVASNSVFLIGRLNSTSYIPLLSDEYSIFNAKLSDAEAVLLYNNGIPGDISSHPKYASNCKAWWRFENVPLSYTSTNVAVPDNTGNNNVLTMFGTTMIPLGKTDVPLINLRNYVIISGNNRTSSQTSTTPLNTYGQSITTTSDFDANSPGWRMFDGIKNFNNAATATIATGGWVSATGTVGTTENAILNLGRSYQNISLIIISPWNENTTRAPYNYTIQYSTDNVTYTNVSGQSPSSATNFTYSHYQEINDINFTFTAVTARYIKVIVSRQPASNSVGISEMSVYQTKYYPMANGTEGIAFDGTSHLTCDDLCVVGPTSYLPNDLQTLSISFWFKFSSMGDTTIGNAKTYQIFDIGALKPTDINTAAWRTVHYNSRYTQDGTSNNFSCFVVGTHAGEVGFNVGALGLAANTWHHCLVKWYNNNSASNQLSQSLVWVNNTALSFVQGGGAHGWFSYSSADKLWLGGRFNSSQKLNGAMKHVAIWKSDISSSRTSLYSGGVLANGPSDLNTTFSANKPYLWYKFDTDALNYGLAGSSNYSLYLSQ